MSSCRENTYSVRHTDARKPAYPVPRNRIINDEVDVPLIGKSRLEYGEVFDRNLLKLLEKFACPSDDTNVSPDLTVANIDSFRHPIEGQLWLDNKNDVLFRYNGTEWIAFSSIKDIAGVSGVIAHGALLPRPQSFLSGYQFDYSECCWIVSPFNYTGEISYMSCYTEVFGGNPRVVSIYRLSGDFTSVEGFANYQIIGIRGLTGGITGELPQDIVIPPPELPDEEEPLDP